MTVRAGFHESLAEADGRSDAFDEDRRHGGPMAFAAPVARRVEEQAPLSLRADAAVRAMPSSSSDPLLQLVATMRMGAILVARDGRVAYLNDAGRESLDAGIGLSLYGDQVVVAAPDIRRKLNAALLAACRPPFVDGAVLLSSTSEATGAKPLRVLSMERIGGFARRSDEGLALLCVGSARQRSPEAAMLSQLFGLTGAESALMAAIASGERLSQCASRRGVSLATVRAQLRNVFVKTGAGTQADLTLIAWSVPGLWIN